MSDIYNWNVVDDSNTDLFPEGMLVKNVNNSARVLQGATARLYSDTDGTLTAGGTADAITITTNQSISAYFDGLALMFDMPGTNTGAVTINVNSLGAKTVKKQATTDVEAGELISGQRIQVSYDGTNFQLVSGFLDADAAASAAAAAASAAAASTSETNAATSETNAATSASNASTSETNAATSASNASTSETNAATSETNAAASAAAADVAKIEWQGAWSGVTAYEVNDAVEDSGSSYICTAAHTNQKPPNASYWDLLAQKGTDGAGDLTAANNLSDVADAATSFGNIKQAASTTATGVVEIATQAEVNTGTDATRSITPATLDGFVNGKTDTAITASDEIVFADVSDSNKSKKDTVQGILDLASGGAWAVKSSGTFSSTELVITGLTKDTHIILTGVNGDDGFAGQIQLSSDGGSTWINTNYARGGWRNVDTSTTINGRGANAQSEIDPDWTLASDTTEESSLELMLYNPSNAARYTEVKTSCLSYRNGLFLISENGFVQESAVAIDAIRFYSNGGGTIGGNYVVLELN